MPFGSKSALVLSYKDSKHGLVNLIELSNTIPTYRPLRKVWKIQHNRTKIYGPTYKCSCPQAIQLLISSNKQQNIFLVLECNQGIMLCAIMKLTLCRHTIQSRYINYALHIVRIFLPPIVNISCSRHWQSMKWNFE